jgi:hypothetical protein
LKGWKVFEILGTALASISLIGVPWYNITVRVERDLWYFFNFSPFYRSVQVGTFIDTQWNYRLDTTLIGLLYMLLVLLPQIFPSSTRIRILVIPSIISILILFATFLPIHFTTATRLSLGRGLYVAFGGIVLMTLSWLYESIYPRRASARANKIGETIWFLLDHART